MTVDQLLAYLLTLWIYVARIAAITASALVLPDSIKIWLLNSEEPPHDRRRNARAWAVASFGCIVGGTAFIAFDNGYVTPFSGLTGDIFKGLTWTLWAFAMVQRAASRAKNPPLIYRAMIFVITGMVLLTGISGRLG